MSVSYCGFICRAFADPGPANLDPYLTILQLFALSQRKICQQRSPARSIPVNAFRSPLVRCRSISERSRNMFSGFFHYMFRSVSGSWGPVRSEHKTQNEGTSTCCHLRLSVLSAALAS